MINLFSKYLTFQFTQEYGMHIVSLNESLLYSILKLKLKEVLCLHELYWTCVAPTIIEIQLKLRGNSRDLAGKCRRINGLPNSLTVLALASNGSANVPLW